MLRFLSKICFVLWFAVPLRAEEPLINFAEFDTYIEQSMQDWLVPGAAVAIVKDGQIIHLKTFGVQSVESKKPVTADTIFFIASLTKGFTAAVISHLVETGKLNWEDKVRNYLPDFKIADEAASAEFTVEDLLSHRSGLPGFAADSLVETGWSAEEIYQNMHKIPLKTSFRSTYDYQNIFPGIAGIIAEKVTGQPLSEVYNSILFGPLNLTHTSIGKDGLTGKESLWTRIKRRVSSYFSDKVDQHHHLNGEAIVIKGGNPALYCFEASRGINASINDMAKWMIFQMNDGMHDGKPLISSENIKRMRTSHIAVGAPQGGRLFPKERVKDIHYGMGWFIHDYDRLHLLAHMGGMTGTRSIIAFDPHEKIGIVVLANLGGMRVSLFPEAIRSKFFDMYLALPDQHNWSQELLDDIQASRNKIMEARTAKRLENPLPEKELIVYAGTYQNDLYGKINITVDGKQLSMTYRNLKVPLKFWNGDNFSFQPNELSRSCAGTDLGDVLFNLGSLLSGTTSVMGVNLFYEGENSVFHQVKD